MVKFRYFDFGRHVNFVCSTRISEFLGILCARLAMGGVGRWRCRQGFLYSGV